MAVSAAAAAAAAALSSADVHPTFNIRSGNGTNPVDDQATDNSSDIAGRRRPPPPHGLD